MVGPRSPKPQTWVRFLPDPPKARFALGDPPVIIYNQFNNMSEQENKPYSEEIEAGKEGLREVITTISNGVTLENFYNPKDEKEPSRIYARDQSGNLIGFIDLDGFKNVNNLEDIKILIANELHIAVTDEEAKKVAVGWKERHFQDKGVSE